MGVIIRLWRGWKEEEWGIWEEEEREEDDDDDDEEIVEEDEEDEGIKEEEEEEEKEEEASMGVCRIGVDKSGIEENGEDDVEEEEELTLSSEKDNGVFLNCLFNFLVLLFSSSMISEIVRWIDSRVEREEDIMGLL